MSVAAGSSDVWRSIEGEEKMSDTEMARWMGHPYAQHAGQARKHEVEVCIECSPAVECVRTDHRRFVR